MIIVIVKGSGLELNSDLDPYKKALRTNLGDHIAEHDRLETILKKLNPSDYIDWDELSLHERFDEPNSYA